MTGTEIVLARLNTAFSGQYEITRELGRGGMATVFLATDVKHGRDVAIKVMHPELAASLSAERFEREIRLAAKLQHPHILGLHDSGIADGFLYYVMPFVEGESLRDRLTREGMLPIDDALLITLEVNDALGYAHKQGVVHRDIKPENILLAGGHALVADFGIARAVSEGESQKLTQTGMSMGTATYMAPEQASGDAVGPTADLYSLGCVLYEMLAGEPPFSGKSSMQTMAKHAMEQVPSVRVVRSVVPEEIEQAIFIVLNKAPADRPQNAEQFAQLLGAPMGTTASMRILTPTMQRRFPTAAHGAIAAMQTRPWWRRPAVLAAAVAVVGGGAFGAWRLTRAARRPVDTGPEAHRIAVLYFDDASKDHSLAPLADGLTEGLIRSLGTAQRLTVISRSGVEKFRRSSLGPDSIARALRAGYLVRGEVEPEGNMVRVSVRLDDASGSNISKKSFTRPVGDLLAMRDSLTVIASDLIRRQLREEIQVRELRAGTANPGAWLLVQRGEQARKRADSLSATGDSAGFGAAFHQADSLFAAAEPIDPKWPEPITARASLAYRRAYLGRSDPALVRNWASIARDHATRALALDPDNADALEFRGRAQYIAWLFAPDLEPGKAKANILAAKADLEKATRLNPSQAAAWAELSHLYYQPGFGSATDVNLAAQRALEADEFLSNADVILQRLFLSSYDLGNFDKAAQWCAETRRRFSAAPLAVRCQLFLLTTKATSADIPLAWTLADSVVARTPAPRRQLFRFNSDMLVAAVIARASKTNPSLADSARHVIRRSEGDATIDVTRDLPLYGAIAYTILGDKSEAVRLLKLHFSVNPQKVVIFREDPGWQFRDLRDDPEFRRLVGSAP